MATFPRLIDDPAPRLKVPLDTLGNGIHFSGEIIHTPTGTTQAVDLRAANHQTVNCGSASGTVTLNITPPTGSASGRFVLVQGATARDVLWNVTGKAVQWVTTEPTYNTEPNSRRIISWTTDDSYFYLMTTVEVTP